MKRVECSIHGLQQETFVCQHIVQTVKDGVPRGFWWANDPDNQRPNAWCSACEMKVQETGGEWTEESESFAGVSLLCGACYDLAIERSFSQKRPWWKFWR
ncbi:hypothetical protein AHAT_21660 [Agarivorans sp. Toyoura001]|uniref:hypothetical protein n=1 Tax=Agarivorans sp. Toyoura001 TaxID=2283141 RepID=UPI0010F35060|nr:hypothetical protein [Agarivorans sp. Toyoura001]GDY26276.1 hypothetical protein AHAT_21660 [Agarivorans sp. Toyoura001]